MELAKRPDVINDTPQSWTPELEDLLAKWHRRMCACQHAYYAEAERLRRLHYCLGIPAVVLSSIVGSAVFASLEKQEVSLEARLMVAIISVTAAILAGLQTFLRLSETAAAHGTAADWFSAIKRDIEQLQALQESDRGQPRACIEGLRKEINKVSQNAPQLRETLWTAVAKAYGVDVPLQSA